MNAFINYTKANLNNEIIHNLINEELVTITGLDYLAATIYLEQSKDAYAIITEQGDCLKVFNTDLLPWEYDINAAILSEATAQGEAKLQEPEGLVLVYIPKA